MINAAATELVRTCVCVCVCVYVCVRVRVRVRVCVCVCVSMQSHSCLVVTQFSPPLHTKGFLCGKCAKGNGVSTTFNRCYATVALVPTLSEAHATR